MSHRTRGVVVSACVLLPLVLAGCGDDEVTIDSAVLKPGDRTACRHLVDALPERLAGQARRTVSPAGAPGAAWGDPAITLTCGVPVPAGFDRFSPCEVANGVGWFVPPAQLDDQTVDVTLTAAGYRPVVRVDLPADYRPEGAAAVIAQLAGPVRRSLELVQPCR